MASGRNFLQVVVKNDPDDLESNEIEEVKVDVTLKQQADSGYRRSVREQVLMLGERVKDDMTLKEAVSVLAETSKLVNRFSNPREALIDVDLTQKLVHRIKDVALDMPTGSKTFSANQFKDFMGTNYFGKKTAAKYSIDKLEWAKMGVFAGGLFKEVPQLDYLHGSFDPGKLPVKPKKERKTYQRRKEIAASTPKKVTEKDTKERDVEEIEQFMICIQDYYEETGKPIGYYPAVLDPTSFAFSIQNMYSVAMLLKQGDIRIRIEDGLPVIYPEEEFVATKKADSFEMVDNKAKVNGGQSQNGEQSQESNQTIVSMNMGKWMEFLKTFKIKEPFYKRTDEKNEPMEVS